MAAFRSGTDNLIPSWPRDGAAPQQRQKRRPKGQAREETELRQAGSVREVSRAQLLAAIAGLLLSACSLFPQKDARVDRDQSGVTVVTYPTEMRGAYVIPAESKATVCSEPAPDVALNTAANISGTVSANVQDKGKLSAETAAKVTSDAIQLAGRSQIVLVARELLYSLCSVSRNSNLSADQIKDIYVEVTKVITTLADAENNSAKARYQEAVNAAHAVVKAQVDKVAGIIEFLTGGTGTLIKGPDGKYTKLEELFTKIDNGSGKKLIEWEKKQLRSAPDAAAMKRVLLDVTPQAIDPLYDAIQSQ